MFLGVSKDKNSLNIDVLASKGWSAISFKKNYRQTLFLLMRVMSLSENQLPLSREGTFTPGYNFSIILRSSRKLS
jgi:hypothetical protein